MKKKVIMLSGKSSSGKDEFFKMANEKFKSQYERLAFADSLKMIAKNLFNWNGEKDGQGRDLLIKIGGILRSDTIYPSDKGYIFKDIPFRKYYNDYAVYNKLLLSEIIEELLKNFTPNKQFFSQIVNNKIMNTDSSIIITDWRFQSEYLNLSLYYNPITVRINRDDVKKINDNSEKNLDNWDKFDYTIENNGSLEDYHLKIIECIKKIGV